MTAPAWLPAPVQRLRTAARARGSEYPAVYLPFARRKYPGPSPQVIGERTRIVIDGYTRAATTYAVYAFQLSQPEPVPMAHHLHAPAQLVVAARRGIPAIALIREPRGAILSQLVREPLVDMRDALVAYNRFYRRLMPYKQGLVVGEFGTVTSNLGAVIQEVNVRFGTDFVPYVATTENEAAVNELVRLRPTLSHALLSFESGLLTEAQLRSGFVDGIPSDAAGWDESEAPPDTWLPSHERDEQKERLRDRWESAGMASARRDAEDAYAAFCG